MRPKTSLVNLKTLIFLDFKFLIQSNLSAFLSVSYIQIYRKAPCISPQRNIGGNLVLIRVSHNKFHRGALASRQSFNEILLCLLSSEAFNTIRALVFWDVSLTTTYEACSTLFQDKQNFGQPFQLSQNLTAP